jgi:membrane metallo-endopeptidase-like protein 1
MRDWWNNATLKQFKDRTGCIEDQYSGYHILTQNISGTQTLGENIADNGGLKTSFYAYKSWLAQQNIDVELPLPGLNHTHSQLFFLSFAQVRVLFVPIYFRKKA